REARKATGSRRGGSSSAKEPPRLLGLKRLRSLPLLTQEGRKDTMASAVIVSAVRTAVGKAPRGTLSSTRPDDLAAVVMRSAIERVQGLKAEDVDDILIGCAMPEAEQGMNVARVAAFRAGIPYTVPAMTLNRFCASGLQSIAFAADRISSGSASCILSG